MPRVNLIGSSNLYTNSTCVFGSMAGLAPTTNVRPSVTGLPGYKYTRSAANGVNWLDGSVLGQSATDKAAGCGLGKHGQLACDDGNKCVKSLGLSKTGVAYYTGSKHLS